MSKRATTKARRKKPLKPFEDAGNAMYRRLLRMSAAQRRDFARRLAALTTTNCGWMIYQMREFLARLCSDAKWQAAVIARERAAKRRQKRS
jgi:hypothetical protein